ncbi:MAG: hypothetical protein LBV60_08335 [Streptomyces sp.]|nr:hypothetical protein [Streptomyces sp.]
MALADALVGTLPAFLLGRWIEQARLVRARERLDHRRHPVPHHGAR